MNKTAPTEDWSDEELLQALCRGENDLFGVLVRRYERELYGYLRRYLNDAALADDVFQNTFLQLFLKRDQYEAGRPVRPWLYTIATHQAIDAMRRAGRHQAVSLDDPKNNGDPNDVKTLMSMLESRDVNPLEAVEGIERRQRVRDSVDALPEFLRQVVILAYYQGLKYKDIADILGIPVGTVKSRLHTALMRLQEAWTDSTTPSPP